MFKYNNFIYERTNWSNERSITEEMFRKFLESKCSDFAYDDNAIYRSVDLDQPYYIMKPTGEQRKSAYVSDNYYTMLINNEWTKLGFPKRTFICTNEYFHYSMQNSPNVYRVIPFNGARVGVCPGDDIQCGFNNSELRNKYHISDITDFNDKLKWFVTSEKFKIVNKLEHIVGKDFKTDELMNKKLMTIPTYGFPDYEKFKESLKNNYDIFLEIYDSFMENIYTNDEIFYRNDLKNDMDEIKSFYNYDNLMKIFNPDKLGFNSYGYNDYAVTDLGKNSSNMHGESNTMHEIWLDSDILLIRYDLEYLLL